MNGILLLFANIPSALISVRSVVQLYPGPFMNRSSRCGFYEAAGFHFRSSPNGVNSPGNNRKPKKSYLDHRMFNLYCRHSK